MTPVQVWALNRPWATDGPGDEESSLEELMALAAMQ